MAGPATSAPPSPTAPAATRRDGLPPGPRGPRAIQTLQAALRPLPFLEGCRRRFGGTFTVRPLRFPDTVVVSDPSSLKRLFGADRVNTIARNRTVRLPALLGPRSLFMLEDDEHMERRKLMLPPFHGDRMRAYERVIEEATLREIEGWPRGRAFPLHPSMQAITFEVILRAVFGVEAGDRRGDVGGHLAEILALSRGSSKLRAGVRRLRRLLGHQPESSVLEASDAVLAALIAERRADPELARHEDILSMLLTARLEDGSPIDDGEMRDQLMTLLLAGHETSATGLAWAFDLLLHAPEKLERLIDELSAGDGEAYLDAVIAEALRVRPVILMTGRTLRTTAELGGWELAPGTAVVASIYLAHTREDVFPEPYEFTPERFLDSKPDTYAWIPFGGGTRRCIGAAFAQLEMAVVVRTVLRTVRLDRAQDRPEPIVRRGPILAPGNGTPVIVREHL